MQQTVITVRGRRNIAISCRYYGSVSAHKFVFVEDHQNTAVKNSGQSTGQPADHVAAVDSFWGATPAVRRNTTNSKSGVARQEYTSTGGTVTPGPAKHLVMSLRSFPLLQKAYDIQGMT